MKRLSSTLLLGITLLWLPHMAGAMSAEQILLLQQAGISDKSIQMLIQEKSIETVSLTVEEILQLKEAGVREDTLQMMIRSLSFLKDSQPVVYGDTQNGRRLHSANDLIMLKNAGFSDQTIRAILTILEGKQDHQHYKDALRILEGMNLWVGPVQK